MWSRTTTGEGGGESVSTISTVTIGVERRGRGINDRRLKAKRRPVSVASGRERVLGACKMVRSVIEREWGESSCRQEHPEFILYPLYSPHLVIPAFAERRNQHKTNNLRADPHRPLCCSQYILGYMHPVKGESQETLISFSHQKPFAFSCMRYSDQRL